MNKHTNDRQRYPADFLLDRPTVNEHTAWNHHAHCEDAGVKTIFGDAFASFLDILLHDVVSPAPAEEGAEKIAAARSYVEKAALERGCEAEAGG